MFPRHLKTLIVLATAALLVLPVAAFAQNARVGGLGVQGDYIKDYTNIWPYPSTLTSVGNMVIGELGVEDPSFGVDHRAVGAVLGNLWDGRYGTFALYINEVTSAIGQGQADPGEVGTNAPDPNVNDNNSFDVEWGKQFGNTRFGLRLRRAFAEQIYTTPAGVTSELKFDPAGGGIVFGRNIIGVAGGLSWEWGSSTMADVAFHYDSRTASANGPLNGGLDQEEDNPAAYLFNARLMWQWQPNAVIVPLFKLYSYDLGFKTVGSPTVEASFKGWQAGGAVNWTLGQDDLFVWGITFAQNKVEQDANLLIVTPIPYAGIQNTITETFTPQVFAALETHVNPWLVLRFGARNGAWHKVKIEADANDEEFEFSDSPFQMVLGAGVKVGTLQLDAVVNDELPFTGGYLFTGNPVGGPALTRITATYPW